MSAKDFGGYKRIVQYFWDPEPKNDDPHRSPIWCLGRRYESTPSADHKPTSSDTPVVENGDTSPTPEGQPRKHPHTSEHSPADGKSNAAKVSNGVSEEDRGWPPDFLDDFESRMWFTYRSGFSAIKRSDASNTATSMTFAVRLRSQLVDQGGFTSDTGWGCMIRSGQSLLANALIISRLGRGAIYNPLSKVRF